MISIETKLKFGWSKINKSLVLDESEYGGKLGLKKIKCVYTFNSEGRVRSTRVAVIYLQLLIKI